MVFCLVVLLVYSVVVSWKLCKALKQESVRKEKKRVYYLNNRDRILKQHRASYLRRKNAI